MERINNKVNEISLSLSPPWMRDEGQRCLKQLVVESDVNGCTLAVVLYQLAVECHQLTHHLWLVSADSQV